MRVLVTGATGFLGRQVLRVLAKRHDDVHAVVRRPAADIPVTWHTADLLRPRERVEILEAVRPTHLVHLAWTTEHAQFWESPQNSDWSQATLDLLESFVRVGGRRVVLAGSCAEYDWTDPSLATGRCVEATTRLQPRSRYGQAKLETYLAATEISSRTGLEMVWARLFFLFGPHENPARLVPSITASALGGFATPLKHPGRVLDFLSTYEAASAFAHLLGTGAVGAFNVASGSGTSVADLASKIYDIVGLDAAVELESDNSVEPESPARVVADITRVSAGNGFRPKYDLDTALVRNVDWWRDRLNEAGAERQSRSK